VRRKTEGRVRRYLVGRGVDVGAGDETGGTVVDVVAAKRNERVLEVFKVVEVREGVGMGRVGSVEWWPMCVLLLGT
jgi:hypothetical protein